MQFAQQHYRSMNISEADMSALEAKAQKIGIDDYVERYLHYPPKGPLPIPRNLNTVSYTHLTLPTIYSV